jgi:hypothetical protein
MCARGDTVNMYNKENWAECGLNGSDKERASMLACYEQEKEFSWNNAVLLT